MCRAHLFKYMICRHFSPNVLWTRCARHPDPSLGPEACPRVRKTYLHVTDLCWRCKAAWRVTLVAPPAPGDPAEWFWCVGREDYSADFELDGRDDNWIAAAPIEDGCVQGGWSEGSAEDEETEGGGPEPVKA